MAEASGTGGAGNAAGVDQPRRKRRWLKWVGIGAGVLVLLLIVLILLAPTIAGSIAPGIAAKQINAAIAGKADVAGASFSWTGSQVVGPVTISSPDGAPVAHVKITIDRGLWSLARAGLGMTGMDLGVITVSGDASITRHADGTTNLQQAIAPRQASATPPTSPAASNTPSGSAGGPSLPKGLTALVNLDKLAVHYHDEGRAAGSPVAFVDLPDVSGKASITDASKASLDLKTQMRYGASANAVTTPGGTLTIAATADSLTDASGKITPDHVKVDASLDVADLSLKAADALAGLNDRLTAALGDSMQAKVHATGTLNDGTVTVQSMSPESKVDLALKASGGMITTDRPGTVEINTAGLATVAPSLLASIKTGDLTLSAYPRVSLSIDSVHIPSALLTGGAADLRTASAHAALQTTEIAGTVRVPEGVAGAKPNSMQPFHIDPFKADVNATDLTKGATVTASTAMSLAGESAGTIAVNLTGGDLLDSAGHRRTGLPSVQGKIEIAGVSTAIAQPLVEKSGIDLPRGVGPKLDLTVLASTAAPGNGAAAPGGASIPPTNLEVQVRSQGVTTDAALVYDGHSLRNRDKDIVVALAKPTLLIGAAAHNAGFEITGDGGYTKLTIKGLNVPIDSAGKIDAQNLAGIIETTLGNFSIRRIPASATPAATASASSPAPATATPAAPAPATDPILLQQLFVTLTLDPKSTPRLDVKGSGSYQNNAFFTGAGLDLPGVRETIVAAVTGGDAAGKAMQIRPVGQIELRNMPTPLVTMSMATPAPGAPDIRALVQSAVGPSISVKTDITARQGSDPTARDLVVAITSPKIQGTLNASVDSKSFDIKESPLLATTVTPELASAIFALTGKKLDHQPTLSGPAPVKLTLLAVSIPMAGLSPQLDKAGDAGVRFEVAGPAVVQNVFLAAADGKPARDIGPIGVRDLVVSATAPISSLAAGSAAKPAKADFSATLLGDGQQVFGTIKAGGQVSIAGGAPSGPAKGTLSAEILNTAKIDSLLDQPGMVSGAVGDKIKIDADGEVTLAPSAPAPASGSAAPAASGNALQSLSAHASITSPRLTTTQPFSLSTKDGIASEDKPAVINWNVDHAWANKFLPKPAPPAAGQPAPKTLLAVSDDTPVSVTVTSLKLAMGGTGGLLKPGVFALDAQVTAPSPKLLVSGVPTSVKNILVRVASGKDPNVLGFTLSVDDLGGGPAAGGKPAVSFTGGLYGIADAQGNPTFGAAKLTASGSAVNVPTPIIDAAASQAGLLVDALGPTVSLTASAKGASGTGGDLTADVSSPRASAKIAGTIKGGTFIVTGKPDVRVTIVTQDLGKRFTKGLPALGNFEKTAKDAPATVTGTNLTVPIDGDMSKLNGTLAVDPGEARFTTGSAFGKILKIVSQKDAGVVGKKLQPLNLVIKQGVITYDRYSIPLGQFTLDTQGTVDLVKKQMDVVTYVPFGALTDEAAGAFNSGLGKGLGGLLPGLEKATMVPIRTKGSFDNPETKPDLQLFLKEAPSNLLKPGQKVGEGLGDLLKGIGQPKDKPKK